MAKSVGPALGGSRGRPSEEGRAQRAGDLGMLGHGDVDLELASGSWGGQRPSLGDYVLGRGPRTGRPRRPSVLVLASLPH
jgi:hypothetical protein